MTRRDDDQRWLDLGAPIIIPLTLLLIVVAGVLLTFLI